jgi:hypothetical protein
MRLSRHFRSREFECPCCGKLGVSQILVCEILEPIRVHFARPVYISEGGGVRCEDYNKRIRFCDACGANYHGWTCEDCGRLGTQRSAVNSWHMRGTQADISIAGVTPQQVQQFARTLPAVTRLGCYRGFTHVGHGGSTFKEWEG